MTHRPNDLAAEVNKVVKGKGEGTRVTLPYVDISYVHYFSQDVI